MQGKKMKPHIVTCHWVISIINNKDSSLKHTLHSGIHEDSCSPFVYPPPIPA